MTGADRHLLETRTGHETLDEIQQTLDEFWSVRTGVPDVVRMHLSIAAAEVGANIIEHAHPGQSVSLKMELRLLANSMRITFTDDGLAANVDLGNLRLPDELAERSRGLPLARAVLSELSYERCGAANRWTLVSAPFV